MRSFRELPIRHKLVAMIMVTSGTVLALASAGYLATDYLRARMTLAADTAAQAALVAESAGVAMQFRDAASARSALEVFRHSRHVRAACLYDPAGQLFADYLLDEAAPCPGAPPAEQERFSGNRLHQTLPARYREVDLGALYVRSDLTFLERRLGEQAMVVLGLLLLALGVALLLSSRLQGIVSDPIAKLARATEQVSARGDYSIRAAKTSEDELGVLVDGFNRMLERIELREAELSKTNEDLRREVAERKRAEQERAALLVREREANRLKDEFLATLSHELRTPLNAILGWTKLLRANAVPPGAVERALEKVERNAQVQARLVEDLLEVSRIASGKLRLDVKPVDLAGIVNVAIDSMRPAAETRGIGIERDFDGAAFPTAGDPDRLQQVVWNLLSNAVKFTPPGGTVTARLRRAAGEDVISVTDTGVGIPPEFLPHVFDTFRQADASSTRIHGGLGLGLSIVRQLVEMHGGRVEAESAGPGQGASFTVRLPVRWVDEGKQPAAPVSLEGRPLAGRTIVVVDDDEDTRELLMSLLSSAGARVVAAASADDALGACLEHEPDALVSDIAMPGQDGYQLIQALRAALGARAPRVTIALTAFAGERDRAAAAEAGFHAHVAKPFEPADLVRILTERLDQTEAL